MTKVAHDDDEDASNNPRLNGATFAINPTDTDKDGITTLTSSGKNDTKGQASTILYAGKEDPIGDVHIHAQGDKSPGRI